MAKSGAKCNCELAITGRKALANFHIITFTLFTLPHFHIIVES